MQYFRHMPRCAWQSGGTSNRSVGGHLSLRNAPNRGLDAQPHLRGLIGRRRICKRLVRRKFARTALPCALPRVLAFPLHRAIHPTRISHSDPTETSNHNIIPCNNGRCPTRLSVATEMPLPIKNRVAVNPLLAILIARE